MKKIISSSVFCLLLSVTCIANGTVLDFEGLTTSSAEDITINNQGYGGFTWDATWYLFTDQGTPAYEGDYGLVNNFGNNPLGLNVSSSTSFDFDGVYAAGWFFNNLQQIRITGYDNLNNLVGQTSWIDLAINQYTYIAANFTGVSRLDFEGGQYFALDNFTYNSGNAVPEPTTMLLFATGLAGLAAIGRRRR